MPEPVLGISLTGSGKDGIKVVEPKLVGSGKAAKMLGISGSTLRRWVQEGRIKPALKLPSGMLRFDPEEVKRVRSGLVASTD